MKENKFVRFITSKYLGLTVQLIATAVFTYFIFVLNIIPLKHLIPITVILALLIINFNFNKILYPYYTCKNVRLAYLHEKLVYQYPEILCIFSL